MNSKQLAKLVIAALEDLKAIDLQVIDVGRLTSVTDYMVIVTGTSSRHVKALADTVIERALEAGMRPLSSQGLEQGEWALVDLNGVVVHSLQASARAHYQLEKLWDLGQPKPVLDEPRPAPKAKAAVGKKAAAAQKPAPTVTVATRKAAPKAAAKKVVVKKAAVKKTAVKKTPVKKAPTAAKVPAGKPAVAPAAARRKPR